METTSNGSEPINRARDVVMIGQLHGLFGKEARSRAADVLARIELTDSADKKVVA